VTTFLDPAEIAPPFSSYSHTALVPPGADVLHISGQVGVRPDGVLPTDVGAQAEQAFRNVLACLSAHDMGPEHLVKLNSYLVRAEDVGALRAARIAVLGDAFRPASTLAVISALASPDWLVEIEAIAARAPEG
jgi:enamine deaminase RidA (YjgF/YER057c/UK114 family)